jgi:carotenoid cleavage dioxygenase
MAEKKQEDGVGAGCPIVEVNPKPQKGLTSKLVDCLEKLIMKLMHDTSQSHPYLSGNFAPVLEETAPVKDLPVEGHLPVSTSTTC